MEQRNLLSGSIRLPVLHYAAKHEVCGQWMIEALRRQGYELSAGTLYPKLGSMAARGYLVFVERRVGRVI
jgi:PadR family transcriptional regulator PadR